MIKVSSKVMMIGAASVLGVALVAGGAHAATGSLSVDDAPGHALHVGGVGPASAHADDTAGEHAVPDDRGSLVETPHAAPHEVAHEASHATATEHSSVSQVAPPAAQVLPTHVEDHSPNGGHGSHDAQPTHH